MKKCRPWLRKCIHTALVCGVCIALSQLLLRNLWLFLRFDPTFSAIFAQIRDACILPPMVTTLLLSAATVISYGWLRPRSLPLAVFSACILLLLLTTLCILFSRVNGVVFFDVVSSLLPLLESGAL